MRKPQHQQHSSGSVPLSTRGGNPHAFVSRGILVALFNGNVETARARDAHLRGLISNPDRAKANGTLPACLVFREERKG